MLKDKFYEYLVQEDIVPYFQEASEVAQELADIAEKEIQYLDRDNVREAIHRIVILSNDDVEDLLVDAICKLAKEA